MRRTILLGGVLPFASAFLGGILASSLVASPQATAQASQLPEVRASAFTLVGTDGTVLASLRPAINGQGLLALHDASGTRRLQLNGAGHLVAYDQDGTTIAFSAGRTFGPDPSGNPPINGVLLGPDGSISVIPRSE